MPEIDNVFPIHRSEVQLINPELTLQETIEVALHAKEQKDNDLRLRSQKISQGLGSLASDFAQSMMSYNLPVERILINGDSTWESVPLWFVVTDTDLSGRNMNLASLNSSTIRRMVRSENSDLAIAEFKNIPIDQLSKREEKYRNPLSPLSVSTEYKSVAVTTDGKLLTHTSFSYRSGPEQYTEPIESYKPTLSPDLIDPNSKETPEELLAEFRHRLTWASRVYANRDSAQELTDDYYTQTTTPYPTKIQKLISKCRTSR